MLGVLIFLPKSWIILVNLELLAKIMNFFFICCQDLGFLRFLARILGINLAKETKKNQDLARNPRSCQWKSEKKITVVFITKN